MASEEHETLDVPSALPADVDDWIDDEATRREQSREEVRRRLVTAVHTAMGGEDGDGEGDENPLPATESDLETLQSQLETHREEFTDLLEDVRERVIQVKRETDRKAPASHSHGEYAPADELREVQASLAALEETTHTGFDNFEEILERLVDESDDLADRSTILANAVVDLRDHRRALAARERRRAAAEGLQLAANRLGIERAACEECASDVTVSLLTRPECPHCGSSFADVTPKSSLFGSHTLETGEPPALEGAVADAVGAGDETDEGVLEAVADTADESPDGGSGGSDE